MDSILKVTDLNLKIPERTLFSNLSFEIPRGKLTCITGENGVGKTTLIKHLLADLAHDYEEHAKFMVQEIRFNTCRSFEALMTNIRFAFMILRLSGSKPAAFF